MDWSNGSVYPNSGTLMHNPNQIIKNMARELEESTVRPSQTNLNPMRHE